MNSSSAAVRRGRPHHQRRQHHQRHQKHQRHQPRPASRQKSATISSSDPRSGGYLLEWVRSHLEDGEPIIAATCLNDALTSPASILRLDLHGAEVFSLVNKILMALPERDILRKTDLVRSMELWKRQRAVAQTRPEPPPIPPSARATQFDDTSQDEYDPDAKTRIFRSPFLAAS